MLPQKRISWFKWRKIQKNGLGYKKNKATKKHTDGKKTLRTQAFVESDGDLRSSAVDTSLCSDRFSVRSFSTSFVSFLALIFFATLGLPSFVTDTMTRCRRHAKKYFLRKHQQAAHRKMMKQQAEFLSFIAVLQSMKGGSTPGRKGFQKGKSGRVTISSQGTFVLSIFSRFLLKGSSVISDNLANQQNTPSDRRRSQQSRSDLARAQLRSTDSQRFSLPTILSDFDSEATIQDSQLDQYEAVTIDTSSILSEKKRRRRGKRRPGHAGPGRGHKTLLGKEFYRLHHISHSVIIYIPIFLKIPIHSIS